MTAALFRRRGTPADAAGIYRSTNGGTNWDSAAAGLPIGKTIRSLISFGAYVFAGTEGDGVYRSSDHGDTWAKTDVNNTLLAQQLVFAFCTKDQALFAGADNGIYKSTDGGATFQRILNGFPPNIRVFAWSITASGGNVVAAVTVLFSPSEALDGIFYSPDNGSTWHQATVPIETYRRHCCRLGWKFPCLCWHFLDKAPLLKGYTNPRMQALPGRKDRL